MSKETWVAMMAAQVRGAIETVTKTAVRKMVAASEARAHGMTKDAAVAAVVAEMARQDALSVARKAARSIPSAPKPGRVLSAQEQWREYQRKADEVRRESNGDPGIGVHRYSAPGTYRVKEKRLYRHANRLYRVVWDECSCPYGKTWQNKYGAKVAVRDRGIEEIKPAYAGNRLGGCGRFARVYHIEAFRGAYVFNALLR